MSAGMRSVHGVTHYEPDRAANGYTLFAPMYGRNVWLVDMWGTIVHRWQAENLPGNYGQLLPSGNLLYAGRTMPPAIPEFAGNGGQLAELDWDGKVVWEYRDPYLSHCFAPLAAQAAEDHCSATNPRPLDEAAARRLYEEAL